MGMSAGAASHDFFQKAWPYPEVAGSQTEFDCHASVNSPSCTEPAARVNVKVMVWAFARSVEATRREKD